MKRLLFVCVIMHKSTKTITSINILVHNVFTDKKYPLPTEIKRSYIRKTIWEINLCKEKSIEIFIIRQSIGIVNIERL